MSKLILDRWDLTYIGIYLFSAILFAVRLERVPATGCVVMALTYAIVISFINKRLGRSALTNGGGNGE